jgi:hypothetical protein
VLPLQLLHYLYATIESRRRTSRIQKACGFWV